MTASTTDAGIGEVLITWVPVLSASFRGRPAGPGAKNGLDHRVGFLTRGWIPMPWEGTWTAAFLKVSSANQSKLGCQIFRGLLVPEELGGPSATEN